MSKQVTNETGEWARTMLGQLCGERGRSINPAKSPEALFELYSVPSFPNKKPEIVTGKEIGSNKQCVEPQSVLLSKINPRINRAWTVGNFTRHAKIASTEWIVFPPTQDVVPAFLCFYLQQNTVRDFLAHNASGVGGSLMRVKPSTLRDFPFAYPKPKEQRRIVAEIEKQFTRLDAGIAALRRTQANLKRYRAAVLKAACEGRLVPTEAELARKEALFGGSIPGKAREAGSTPAALHGVQKVVSSGLTSPTSRTAGSNPVGRPMSDVRDAQTVGSNLSAPSMADTMGVGGSTPSASSSFETGEQLLARILTARRQRWQGRRKYMEPAAADSMNLQGLPEGWVWSTVEQLVFLDLGFAFKSAEFERSGIRLLRGENLEPGRFRWTDTRYWPKTKLADFQCLLIREGEIVLAMDRPLISSGLKIARARADDVPCLLVQRMARFRPVVEMMTSFLFCALNTDRFIKHLVGGQQGTQLPHISGDGIQSFPVPLPSLAEQRRIVAEVERRLSVVEELESVVSANLQRATRLRQSILRQAFTNKMVVAP